MAQIARVCDALGVEGLHQALRCARDAAASAPREVMTAVRFSYRIGPDRRTAIPMVTSGRPGPPWLRSRLRCGEPLNHPPLKQTHQ